MKGTQSPELPVLKGSPLSILVALLLSGKPMDAQTLAAITGYCPNTMRRGLRTLVHYGLIEFHSHSKEWMLTPHGQQLIVPPAAGPGARRQAKNSRVPRSSSSSGSGSRQDFVEPREPPPPQPQAAAQKLPLPPPWEDLLCNLVQVCSIPEIRGRKAIQAARQRGDLPAQVLYNALVWLAYCQEPGSAKITNHAYLIAARIQDGTPPPKSYRPSKRSSLWPRIVEAKRRWTQQLAERHSGQRARSGPDTEAPEAAVF